MARAARALVGRYTVRILSRGAHRYTGLASDQFIFACNFTTKRFALDHEEWTRVARQKLDAALPRATYWTARGRGAPLLSVFPSLVRRVHPPAILNRWDSIRFELRMEGLTTMPEPFTRGQAMLEVAYIAVKQPRAQRVLKHLRPRV